MAMVNPGVLNMAAAATNVKDSRWLTLEVCREFQRNKCTRSDQECKFAHPPPHVEVQNGRVTACFDSIKGKCQRKEPPCKYLHPPQHLREQLLQNGRNNLIIRNLQMQALNQHAALNQPVVPGLVPIAHPYLGGTPTPTSAVAYNPYVNGGIPTIAIPGAQTNGESPSMIAQHPAGCIPTPIPSSTTATKVTRPDRLESQIPGMVGQYKRVAVADAKGVPMYQPISNMAPFQQAIAAMQLQQPQYIPVSFTGHPPSVQRF